MIMKCYGSINSNMTSKLRSQSSSSSFNPGMMSSNESLPSSFHSSSFPPQPRFDRSFLQKPKGKKTAFELSEHDKREIKESFALFDTKKQGRLDYYELKVCRKHFLFSRLFLILIVQVAIRSLGVEIKKAEVLQLIEQYGEDNSVDYDAFVEISLCSYSFFFTWYNPYLTF